MFDDDLLDDNTQIEFEEDEITEELFGDHAYADAWEWANDDDPTFGF